MIELTDEQITQIVRSLQREDQPNLAAMLASFPLKLDRTAQQVDAEFSTRLSRSLYRGLIVIAALPSAEGTPVGVIEVANQLGMSPSSTHRYLSTLVEVGWAIRDPKSRKYHRCS